MISASKTNLVIEEERVWSLKELKIIISIRLKVMAGFVSV